MSFVRHEPCPRCGSRDNLGRYSDGGAFCFGCGHFEPGSINPWIKEKKDGQNQTTDDNGRIRPSLPKDASNIIRDDGRKWLDKYSIKAEECLRAGWKWSPSWEQLIFPFYDRENKLCCVQARNFNPQRASKAKYYNQGEKSKSWTIYRGPPNPTGIYKDASNSFQDMASVSRSRDSLLVLTEDAVSSLVVARTSDAMPLLGTHITKEKLMALKPFYDRLVVFLDPDKYRESRNISDQAKLIGFKSWAIYTEKDPKDFSPLELEKILTA